MVCCLALDELLIFQRGFRLSMSRNNSVFSKMREWSWTCAMGQTRTSSGCGLRMESSFMLNLLCAWASPIPLAALAEPPSLPPCSQAPRWTCYEKEGFLEVENASLFLKKQGFRVVVKKGRKYLHSWMKIDVNQEGKPVNESLCSKKGEFFLSELILKVLLNILLFCIQGKSTCSNKILIEDS